MFKPKLVEIQRQSAFLIWHLGRGYIFGCHLDSHKCKTPSALQIPKAYEKQNLCFKSFISDTVYPNI